MNPYRSFDDIVKGAAIVLACSILVLAIVGYLLLTQVARQ